MLGHADDGGWWALGLLQAQPGVFRDIPMSTPSTGERQGDRLRELGLGPGLLPPLVDVDEWAHAVAVAHQIPTTRFGRCVAGICSGIDAVCHQAARVGLGVDFDDVAAYVEDNSLGTAVLLRALHRVGFSGRLVQASSMVVYGEGCYACPEHRTVRPGPRLREALEAGQFEPGCPTCGADLVTQSVLEDQPLDPRNVYAATKVNQEHLGHAFAAATGADVVSLRYHNVYGPRMPRDTPYAGVASIVRSACEGGRSPRVFEDGGQRRDFIHVADVALANRLALTAPDPIMGSYNIATGRPTTILQMAHAVCSGVGDGDITPLVTGEYRIGDVRHITASPDLARRTFGFQAQIDANNGLREFATAPMRASLAGKGAPDHAGPG